MSEGPKRASWNRRRSWLGVAVLAWIALCVSALLPHVGIGRGITEANGHRIAAGMTRTEVEAVLGTPNPLPDLEREGEAFWDANVGLGCRYGAVYVAYDADGRVARTRVWGWWRSPPWKFW